MGVATPPDPILLYGMYEGTFTFTFILKLR
jgi:hypothetical protein